VSAADIATSAPQIAVDAICVPAWGKTKAEMKSHKPMRTLKILAVMVVLQRFP
jgi:hypothetical protein